MRRLKHAAAGPLAPPALLLVTTLSTTRVDGAAMFATALAGLSVLLLTVVLVPLPILRSRRLVRLRLAHGFDAVILAAGLLLMSVLLRMQGGQ